MRTTCRFCNNSSTAISRYGLRANDFFGIAAGAFLILLLGRLKDHVVPLATAFVFCTIPAVVNGVNMNDWMTVPGLSTIYSTNITINHALLAQFYRLVYP
jgi:hypothetical protein